MKLFQRLLVAPAALGLLAPMAANAAELNINGVSDYAASSEVQSFTDIYPTDWAFQALTSLAERHGCAVANPTGTITRYEAAALLNKCIGNIAEVNEEERRLINEFAPELAVIKGRVDGLEARVGEFEAGQFSKTTKLSGKAAFIVGQVSNDADATDTDGLTMEYMYQLDMNTSFSGDDLLYTRIKTGNVGDHFKDSSAGMYLSDTNAGHKYDGTNYAKDSLYVDKIWYQFPIGDSFKAWVGPKIENYYMLASAPSIYKPVLKQFALGGNGPVYGSSTQPGFGVAWTQQLDDPYQARWAVSAAYTAQNGENSTNKQGMFGEDSKSATLIKVEYGAPRWQVSLAASFKTDAWTDSYYATAHSKIRATDASSTNWGLRAYWKPEESGAIPEVQFGYDIQTINDNKVTPVWDNANYPEEAQSWMIGLGWKDLFVDGNRAGIAFGQRLAVTKYVAGSSTIQDAKPFSGEAYYTFQVSDNVSITPAYFFNNDPTGGIANDDNSGYVVLTNFRF